MKTLICIATMFVMLCFSGCASTKMYIFGVDVDEIVKEKDMEMIMLGAIASIATHVAGHYIAAEFIGANIDQQGVREIVTNPNELTDSDERWVARGGFVVQTIVNTALTSFKSTRKLKFTRGYTMGTIVEIGTYPIRWRDEGDLNYLENNRGNGSSEWSLYMGFSAYNFYRINKALN